MVSLAQITQKIHSVRHIVQPCILLLLSYQVSELWKIAFWKAVNDTAITPVSFICRPVYFSFNGFIFQTPLPNKFGDDNFAQSITHAHAWSAPCHYLNQCWYIGNWTFRNKLQWSFKRNLYIFIQENVSECVAWNMAGISSRPQFDKKKTWKPAAIKQADIWLLFSMLQWL